MRHLLFLINSGEKLWKLLLWVEIKIYKYCNTVISKSYLLLKCQLWTCSWSYLFPSPSGDCLPTFLILCLPAAHTYQFLESREPQCSAYISKPLQRCMKFSSFCWKEHNSKLMNLYKLQRWKWWLIPPSPTPPIRPTQNQHKYFKIPFGLRTNLLIAKMFTPKMWRK